MTEAQRIARRARQLGYRAVTLGNATEEHWLALRVVLDCENADDTTLVEVVEEMLRHELDATRQEV